jgi:rod shape-determining protein MreB
VSGLPRTVEITSAQIRDAIAEPVTAIIDAVKSTLDRTPPELAADIMDRGIYLSGGGALLAGLTQRINSETGMPCYVAPDPLYAVAIGSGRALENIEAMRGMMSSPGLDQQ